jgi:glycosyltransferase involved in cell wall biosynthesis
MRDRGTDVTLVAHDVGGIGGMERVLAELVRALLVDGRRVTVIARACRIDPAPGLTVVRVGTPARPFALAYPLFLLLGTLAVARHRRGLVHVTGAIVLNRVDVASVHLYHRGLARRAPSVRSDGRSLPYRLNAWVSAVMSRAAERVYRRARVVTAVSAGLAAEMREDPLGAALDVRVVHNGVDVTEFGPDAARRRATRDRLGVDGPVAVFVGGEWERKGLERAIRAVGAAGWTLLVAGPGDQDRYERVAAQAGADVRWLGRRDDVADLLRAGDAFLLPTAYETFSLVTYEAAATGLPLLAGRVSGIEDILVEGVNGWFTGDDHEAIAARLRELAEDPARRARMGAAAQDAVAAFTWARMASGYAALYDELARSA